MIRKEAEKFPNGKKTLKALAGALSDIRFAREYGEDELLEEAKDTLEETIKNVPPKDRKKIKYLATHYSKLSDTVDEIRAAKGETITLDHEGGSETEEDLQKYLKNNAYWNLGGEQEARAVGERLLDRTGTPIAHDEEALIIFGGKTYGMTKRFGNKKNASENGDGELVKDGDMRGQAPPSAATAGGTTNHWSPTSFQTTDNKGGVSVFATVDTNSPKKIISQAERDNKPKYSIGRSSNSTQSLRQRITNKVFSWFDSSPRSKKRNKLITDNLSKIMGMRTTFGYVKGADQTIIDDFNKIIREPHAYRWETFLPKIGGKVAQSLKLNPTTEMGNYITDWMLTGALNNNSSEAADFQKAMRDNPAQAELGLTESMTLCAARPKQSPCRNVQKVCGVIRVSNS